MNSSRVLPGHTFEATLSDFLGGEANRQHEQLCGYDIPATAGAERRQRGQRGTMGHSLRLRGQERLLEEVTLN